MKIRNILLASVAIATATSCSGQSKASEDSNTDESNAPKVAVCYFSATGTTKAQARRLADLLGADLYEIAPATPYTEEDLDWRNDNSRSSVEMKDPQCRPALAENPATLKDFDIVFIGYPIWWDLAPRVVNTFIENSDLKGKTLVPFMTSGSSSIDNSVKVLSETYPDLKFAQGSQMNSISDEEILEWVSPLGLSK